ncbi:hypothetical protein O3M35_007502 [Rhynocoris fuscipes]|uniref:Odorant receptor n=1 Tax=Rhynocoris fuscipes TaxID=488301 RepID=A0AAW1DAC3_9HEMI
MILTFTKRNKFYRIYEIINSGFYNYNEPLDEYILKTKSGIEKEKYYLGFLPLYILVLSAAVVSIGPIIDRFTGNTYEDIKSIKSFNVELPVKAWYPYDTSEGILYYVSLIGQVSVSGLVGGIIGSVDLVYINCIQELILQLRILIHSINNLEKRARNRFKQIYSKAYDIKDYYHDERYQRCYFYCLKQNIIHHQIIKKYYDEFQSYLSMIIFPAFSTATIVIALSMHEMAQESKNIGSGLVSTMLVLAEVLNTLLLCMYGEKVNTLSHDLRDTIYNTKWYNSMRNPYIKNLLPIMQEFTKKTLIISDRFAKANLETFSTVMNSAYSYFNLLSASNST